MKTKMRALLFALALIGTAAFGSGCATGGYYGSYGYGYGGYQPYYHWSPPVYYCPPRFSYSYGYYCPPRPCW